MDGSDLTPRRLLKGLVTTLFCSLSVGCGDDGSSYRDTPNADSASRAAGYYPATDGYSTDYDDAAEYDNAAGVSDAVGGAAAANPATAADDVTATACETYCDNALSHCTGNSELYADKSSCLTACDKMPEGTEGDTSGNSAWCRAYHAGDPAASDPETHCAHASEAGGGVCE